MSAWAHEVAGTVELVLRVFPGSLILLAKAEGDARRAQQAAKASRRLIPRFVSSAYASAFSGYVSWTGMASDATL
jgi:hypothetical protein